MGYGPGSVCVYACILYDLGQGEDPEDAAQRPEGTPPIMVPPPWGRAQGPCSLTILPFNLLC